MARAEIAGQVQAQLARMQVCHELCRQDAAIAGGLQGLRHWQASRLARTYQDLRDNPRYEAAVEFFLSDLYPEAGSEQRDRLLQQSWPLLRRTLPLTLLQRLAQVLELQALTLELDVAMARALGNEPLSARSYRLAYRRVGQQSARARQIELLVSIGAALAPQLHGAWAGIALRVAHAPAYAAGFGALQSFLERGHAAFRALGEPGAFLALIRERESRLMRVLLNGEECAGLQLLQWQDGREDVVG